jgi:CRP/FNR family transcriptional regulator, transcriptional activator FtrB
MGFDGISQGASAVAPVWPPAGPVPDAGALFRGVPWLTDVPGEMLDRLASRAVIHRVPAGAMIFDQADIAAFATLLMGGRVELVGVRGRDEILVELVSPIDMLLPAAVLTSQPYLLRARVLDDAHLLMVQADVFRSAILSEPRLCQAILALQAAHFRRQVKQSKNVRLRSAEERIAAYLLQLADGTSEKVKLPLGKALIASQLGVTRETFSRTLQAVARHGIRVDGDTVTVTDFAAAEARFPLDPLIDGAETITPLRQAVTSATNHASAARRRR